MYGDADFKDTFSKKDQKILINEIKFVYTAMFIPAIAPLKPGSLPGFEFAKKYLETVNKIYNKTTINKCIKKLKKEHPKKWSTKWFEAIFNLLDVAEFGYSTTVWEVCGSYIPCDSCSFYVDSYSISELGDQDHYIKRKWSLGNKSGIHENKGKNY